MKKKKKELIRIAGLDDCIEGIVYSKDGKARLVYNYIKCIKALRGLNAKSIQEAKDFLDKLIPTYGNSGPLFMGHVNRDDLEKAFNLVIDKAALEITITEPSATEWWDGGNYEDITS